MSGWGPLLQSAERLDPRAAFLADMAEAVKGNEQGQPYPGYPTKPNRLYIARRDIQHDRLGRLVLPSDPRASYTVFEHSVEPGKPRPHHAFHDDGGPLPSDVASRIVWGGMQDKDNRGFPLHPYTVDMLTNRDVGVVIGPGYFYQPGWKEMVDLGVLALGHPGKSQGENYPLTPAVRAPSLRSMGEQGVYLAMLVVQRADTGQYALPGGEVEKGESARQAAIREAYEETGMQFTNITSRGKHLVADPRLTTCTAVQSELFVSDAGEIPKKQPRGGDDATRAEWVIVDDAVLKPGRFFGSHRRMVLQAVAWYQRRHKASVRTDGWVAFR